MNYVVYSCDYGIEFFPTKEQAVEFAKERFSDTDLDSGEEFIAEIIPHKFQLIVE